MTWRARRHPADEPPPVPRLAATLAEYRGIPPTSPEEPPVTRDPFDDPFALPLYDVETGEVLDPEPEPAPLDLPPREHGEALWLVTSPPADPDAWARGLRDALIARLNEHASSLAEERPDGRLTDAAVQREVVALTHAHDALRAAARAFSDAADLARTCLSEITLEVRGDRVEREGGSTSIRVGGPGGDIRVTVSQATKTSVDADAVLDVVVGAEVEAGLARAIEAGATATSPAVVGAVVRGAIERWRSLMGPPSWKVTALDVWRRQLEAAGDPAAQKLGAAYGRKPHGSPTTRVEHVPPPEEEG